MAASGGQGAGPASGPHAGAAEDRQDWRWQRQVRHRVTVSFHVCGVERTCVCFSSTCSHAINCTSAPRALLHHASSSTPRLVRLSCILVCSAHSALTPLHTLHSRHTPAADEKSRGRLRAGCPDAAAPRPKGAGPAGWLGCRARRC